MQMKFPSLAAIFGLLAALPAHAQTAAEDGTAKVLFILDRTGSLISSALVESTGSSELDAAALAMVEAAAPFPEPPAEIEENSLHLTAPIVFRAKTTLPASGSLPPAESATDHAKVDSEMPAYAAAAEA